MELSTTNSRSSSSSSSSDPEPRAVESGGRSLKRLTIGLPLSISSLVAHCTKPKPKPKAAATPHNRHLRLHLYLNGESPLVRRSKHILTQITNHTNHNKSHNQVQDDQGGIIPQKPSLVSQSKHLLTQITNKAITLVHKTSTSSSSSSAQNQIDTTSTNTSSTSSTRSSPLRSPVMLRQYSKKLMTQIGNKAVTLVHRSKSNKQGVGEMEDEFGDGGVWQRSILMGDKCQPLAFSGVIYYDSRGKRVVNDRQLALPFHTCPTCGK
ncbi:hypothetical protein LINPERHAP1_LOCUS35621 [Linum perenne]